MAGQSCKESILIVDDNAITCEVVQRNLELEGYHIFTALSVEDATKTRFKTAN